MGAALSTLASTLITAGYEGIRGGTGYRLNINGTAYTVPSRPENVPWKHYNCFFDGDTVAFTATTQANIDVEVGITGAGVASGGPLNIIYGPRTCTQTLKAGMDTMTGVTDRRNLVVGDTMLVRLGADPTDASGVAFSYQMLKIKTITPGSGNTADIQFDRPFIETPQFPLPSYNINSLRFGNQHDILKVTGFQDDLLYEDCVFRKADVGTQYGRRFTMTRTKVPTIALFWISFGAEDAIVSDTRITEIQGANTSAGDPHTDPFANYGGGFVLDNCRNTLIHNLSIQRFSCSGGVMDCESQCRGTRFTGNTRVSFDNHLNFVSNSFVHTPNQTDIVAIEQLTLESGGASPAGFSPNIRINKLWLGAVLQDGSAGQAVWAFIHAGTVSDYLVYEGKEYRSRKRGTMVLSNMTASGSFHFPIPNRGVIRNMRVYPSSVTGLTTFSVGDLAGTFAGADEVGASMFSAGAGVWAKVKVADQLVFGTGNWNSPNNDQRINITTGGSFSPSTYFIVDYEVFVSEGPVDLSLALGDTTVPNWVVGSGAPSANAGFVGQKYLDQTNHVIYEAAQVGAGAADWSTTPVLSTSITDSTSSGRAMITAASIAAQAKLLGGVILTQGTNLTNADATIDVTQGASRLLPAGTLSGLHTLTLGNTSATDKQVLQVIVESQGSNYLINDSAATLLLSVASSTKVIASFTWDQTTAKFVLAAWAFFT